MSILRETKSYRNCAFERRECFCHVGRIGRRDIWRWGVGRARRWRGRRYQASRKSSAGWNRDELVDQVGRVPGSRHVDGLQRNHLFAARARHHHYLAPAGLQGRGQTWGNDNLSNDGISRRHIVVAAVFICRFLNDFKRCCDLALIVNVCRRNLNDGWRSDVAVNVARRRRRHRRKTFSLDRIRRVDDRRSVSATARRRSVLKIGRIPNLK